MELNSQFLFGTRGRVFLASHSVTLRDLADDEWLRVDSSTAEILPVFL
jgi:hypothetical protein